MDQARVAQDTRLGRGGNKQADANLLTAIRLKSASKIL
jgi:hypothetical protein